ncbi:MAG TPA: hypothetical protein VD994_12505 [Prosthecobacter sp.]|nr:hypothetical protein [Prosthecobacter sp.]
MEPLSPNDPLWKLLGQAKPVEPRPNFAQNVLRAARQTPQERGLVARVRAWFEDAGTGRIAWVSVAAAIAVLAALPFLDRPQANVDAAVAVTAPVSTETAAETAAVANVELPPASDTQWENMQQFDALLAVYDTSELSDRDIHVLLY